MRYLSLLIALILGMSVSKAQQVLVSTNGFNTSCNQACVTVDLDDSLSNSPGLYTIVWDWNDPSGATSTQQVFLPSGSSTSATQCFTYNNPDTIVYIGIMVLDSLQDTVYIGTTAVQFLYCGNQQSNLNVIHYLANCNVFCVIPFYSDSTITPQQSATFTYYWGDGTMDTNTVVSQQWGYFDDTLCHNYSTTGNYSVLVVLSFGNKVDSQIVNIYVPDTCGSISGKAFVDANGNCSYDPGEQLVPNVSVDLYNNNSYIMTDWTDAQGEYDFGLLTGSSYSIQFSGTSNYSIASGCPSSYTNVSPNSQNSYDFALVCYPDSAGSGNNFSAWPFIAAPGFTSSLTVYVCNDSCQSITRNISIQIPNGVIFNSYIANGFYNYTYNSSQSVINFSVVIPAASCGYIDLYLLTDSSGSVMVGDTLCFDVTVDNSTSTVCDVVLGSWDPNDKQVFPTGTVEPGTPLTYKIRFQNTGTAPAYKVVIRDTLDSNLDPNSITDVSSSHSMNYSLTQTITGKSVLVFSFDNIYLPDSASDPQGSNGFVVFKISPKANIPLGTQVSNKAGIYFDYNPVVITNTVTITYDKTTSISGLSDLNVKVYPNPARDYVFVDGSNLYVKLYDIRGNLIKSEYVSTSRKLDISGLSTGIYILQLKRGEAVSRIKLSVIK